jgi:hypothetical protein
MRGQRFSSRCAASAGLAVEGHARVSTLPNADIRDLVRDTLTGSRVGSIDSYSEWRPVDDRWSDVATASCRSNLIWG